MKATTITPATPATTPTTTETQDPKARVTPKAKRAPKTTVTDLSLLSGAFGRKKLIVPTLDLGAENEFLDEEVKEELEAEEQNRGSIADALKRLANNNRAILACGTDETKVRIVEGKNKASDKTCHDYIDAVLTDVEGVLKTLAARTVITTDLSMGTECATPEELKCLIHVLVRHELLKTDTNGKGETVQIYHRVYGLGNYEFDRKDLTAIRDSAQTLFKALRPKEREWERAKSAVMAETANIPFADALKGRNGTCLVHVPARVFETQGVIKRSKKGDLLLCFGDKFVEPISATGAIGQNVSDIIERGGADQLLMRKFLTVAEKTTKEPGFFVSLARDLGKRFDVNLKDDWATAEDLAKDWLSLFRMIKRAEQHLQDTAAAEEACALMEKVAEITPAEFFGTNGLPPVQEKDALLRLIGVVDLFRDNLDDLYDPFLLVMRTAGDDGQECFKVTEIPPFLEAYLGKLVGKKILANDRSACPRLFDLIQQIGQQVKLASASEETANTAAA